MLYENVKNVNSEEAHKLISDNKDLIILDVRNKEDYDNGHIPGAKLVPVQVISTKLTQLDKYKDKPILVYCETGRKSPLAVNILSSNSFKNIYHLTHGISCWKYNTVK